MPVASFWFGKLVGFTLRTVLNLNKTFLQTIKGAMEGKGWGYSICWGTMSVRVNSSDFHANMEMHDSQQYP